MEISLYLYGKDGSYMLSTAEKEDTFWLENQDGESIYISEKNVFDMLDREFKENF